MLHAHASSMPRRPLPRVLLALLGLLVACSFFTTIRLLTSKPRVRYYVDLPGWLDVSVLHPRTTTIQPLHGERLVLTPIATNDAILETTQQFAQHGRDEPGVHFRLQNQAILQDTAARQKDPLLLVLVFNNKDSWGPDRSSADFFQLIANFSHPKHQTSLTMLTSSMDEFRTIQTQLRTRIREYAQFSLIYRNDFMAEGLTRGNRHAAELQTKRRSMLARYRNFALLSTLEPWHQHVVWLDADVHTVPGELVTKMIQADRDVLEPICYRGHPPSDDEYDHNAWVGVRLRHMILYRNLTNQFIPLDSVGGTMLYVKADIHRQGVIFPTNFLIGASWEKPGNDGIETEGLCYMAHFLGYRCWGMPHDAIYHVGY